MDNSVVGNYGTLRLMKKNGQGFVAAYPIDDDEITFGRGSSCDVRLYYSWVSPVQCKLFFEDRKAMLMVLGANGVVIDGCPVLPTESGQPATVPLSNGSRIVINTKQFVFEYPPKEMRAALINTPRPSPRKTRRSLRLSMIQTAQVFSPLRNVQTAPQDEQIAALTSPVRPFKRDLRDEQEIVMCGDINNAVVVEEDRDLIVLEEVDLPPEPVQEPPTPTPAGRRISFATADNLRTPPPNARRRSNFTLHKAVLLRSAQKAHEKHAEEREEDEVELAVSPERELGPPSDDSDEEHEEPANSHVSPFRAGLDVIKSVFGRKSVEGGTQSQSIAQEDDPMDQDESLSESEEDVVLDYGTAEDGSSAENEATPRASAVPSASREEANPFYTPQPLSRRLDLRTGMLTGPRRVPADNGDADTGPVYERPGYSLGGAQRVRVIEPWKVSQLDTDAAPKSSQVAANKPTVDEEDAQVVIDRMKGKVEEMRRKSLARRERNSLAGGRGLFDLQPTASPAVAQRLPSPARSQPSPDVIMEETASQSRDEGADVAAAPSVGALSLYPTLPTIDFSGRKPRSPTKAVPATPVFTGVRELFTMAAPVETPVLTGVKDLFKMPAIHTVPATPALQAASDLFAQEARSASDDRSDQDDDAPSRPASRIARHKPSSHSSASTAIDDADSGSEPGKVAKKPATSRATRKVQRTTPETGAPTSEIATTKHRATSAKSRTVEPSESGEDELLLGAEPPATKSTRARRMPAPTDDEEPKPSISRIARPTKNKAVTVAQESATAPEPKKPARATRATELSVPAPAKVARRTRTPEVDSAPEEATKKVRATAKTAIARKAAAPAVADKENDDASSTGEADVPALKPASKRRVATKTTKSTAVETPAEPAPRVTRSRARK